MARKWSAWTAGGAIADGDKFPGLDVSDVADLNKTWTALQLATYIIAQVTDSAPSTLDTLNELAAALGDDPNFATTVASALALKAPLASPALTGTPTAPTASGGTNTTQIATTAFVASGFQPLDADLTAIAALATDAFGRSLLTQASARAVCALIGAPYTLAKSAVQASHTGDTSEHTFATITIPAGAMGPNGQIEVTALFSGTNSANNKTGRIKLASSTFYNASFTTSYTLQAYARFGNRGAQNSQVGHAVGSASAFGAIAGGPQTPAVDTSAAQDIIITGQLANSGETVTLESYIVKLTYGA